MLWLAFRALSAVVMLVLAGFGCGAWIANVLPATCNRIERVGISLLGGLGIFSLTLFLIGQISFSQPIIVTTVGAAVLLSVRPVWRALRNLKFAQMTTRDAFIPCLIVLIVLVLTAVAGIAEITGDWNQDAVAYHLLGPTVWLREGVIRPVLDNSHTAFPQIPEALFAVLLAVGGSRAPDFSSWLTLGLLLLICAGFAMRMGLTASQGWWVAAIVATMPAVYAGSHNCFVDGVYAALILAAARIGFDAENIREWAIFGVFCGLAMGTKYTGLLALHQRLQQFRRLHCCSDCYRVERTSSRAGSTPAVDHHLFTAHPGDDRWRANRELARRRFVRFRAIEKNARDSLSSFVRLSE
jgi:hypothetical protein